MYEAKFALLDVLFDGVHLALSVDLEGQEIFHIKFI